MKYVAMTAITSLFLSVAAGPTSAQKDIPRGVLGNGGTKSASTNFAVRGTAGQPAIGAAASDSQIEFIGYWYTPGTTVTGVNGPGRDPIQLAFRLHQNYPNPFNPTTTIQFDVPESAHATLVVYDIAGRRVTTLIDAAVDEGVHRVTFDATALASGIYFYRIEAGRFQETRRLALLK